MREVAIATVDKENWLRWPAMITDTTGSIYCKAANTTIGNAIRPSFFTSSTMHSMIVLPTFFLLLFFQPFFVDFWSSLIPHSVSFRFSIKIWTLNSITFQDTQEMFQYCLYLFYLPFGNLNIFFEKLYILGQNTYCR